MASKKIVQEIYEKGDDGLLSNAYKIGASFKEVVDSRSGKGNYSLEQFFDNYVEFMKNSQFVYMGATKPQNSHVVIWLDTNKTNQD